VRINLESTDAAPGGGELVKHFSGTWKLVWNSERKGWLLDEPKIQQVTAATGSPAKVLPLFQPILPALKQATPVKVLLPAEITGADPAKLYASLEKADQSGYFIDLGFTPDCQGATACHFGSLAGQAVTPALPPLSGQKVALANGLTGYYLDATCGASCGDSVLGWEQANVRYTVGSKAAKLDTLLKIANSAITNGVV
jgi:hypothetical protein